MTSDRELNGTRDQNILRLFLNLFGGSGIGKDRLMASGKELEKRHGAGVLAELLRLLVQKEFNPREAREHWEGILRLQDHLRQDLGRDVGLLVAACDYFTNLKPKLEHVVFYDLFRLMEQERSILLDELTGIANRRYFNQALEKEIENSKRTKEPLSLLMIDVDHFKEYNDAFGHLAGDEALKSLVAVMARVARKTDHLIRYGGEEFAVLLPRCGLHRALIAAERHRLAIREHCFPGEDSLPLGRLTITIGVATFPFQAKDGPDLIRKADQALYHGKRAGRNRVALYSEDQRKHDRIPVALEVLYRPGARTDQPYRTTLAEDISLGGLRCRIGEPVNLETPIEIILSQNQGGPALKLDARPVYFQNDSKNKHLFFMGMSFALNSKEQEKALNAIIEKARTCLPN